MDSVWVSLGEMARREGVTRPVMGKRVTRLANEGLLEIRPGPYGAKLLNCAQYDHVRSRTRDAIRMQAAQAAAMAGGSSSDDQPALPLQDDPSLAMEQARRVGYQAQLAKLDLQERLKELLPTSDVQEAFRTFGEVTVRAFDRIIGYADEIAANVGRDGSQGARAVLKRAIHESRFDVAEEIDKIIGTLLSGPPRQQSEGDELQSPASRDQSLR